MGLPPKQGLYDPANEHDSCGVGFVANIKGRKSHEVIEAGLQILVNLDHRGAVGADPLVGDGAGILIQIPDQLYRAWADEAGVELPPAGEYAVAMCFLPQDTLARTAALEQFEHFLRVEKQPLLGWRDVPIDTTGLGEAVLAQMPVVRQAFIGRGPNVRDQDAHERKLLAVRKQTQNPLAELAARHNMPSLTDFYMPSLSTRTVVYKGLLLAHQVGTFYTDLLDERATSAMALVHQRFSTNTFPSWKLAHPYRFIAHNGEINTVRGNVNWMNARRRTLESDLLGPDLNKMWPLIPHGQSDTACLDNALELLVAGGYPLAQAVMMLIPEAWAGNPLMDAKRRAFYEYHAALMEPWDGPAAVAFTDGRQIGATLDRNGLRPARFIITDQDHVIMASEVGVLDVPEERIVRKWRLQPGKMLLIDMEEGRIIEDEEIKRSLADAEPYSEWLAETQFKLEELGLAAEPDEPLSNDPATLLDRQQAFGYTQEDLAFFLEPMAKSGDDPLGSMGSDTPIAVLSKRPKLLYEYFKQNFAQVTNPPIDPIREELVMSLVSMIGPRPNLLGRHAGNHKRLEVAQPILTDEDLAKIRAINELLDGAFRTATLGRHLGGRRRSRRARAGARPPVPRGHRPRVGRRQHPDPVGSGRIARPHPDPGGAGHGCRAPPPDPPGPADADGLGHRDRRSPRGAPFLRAGRLRRRGGESVPRLPDHRAHPHPERPQPDRLRGAQELHQGHRQGRAEGDVQDGHLHLPVLLRGPDLRRGRPRLRPHREVLHRHRLDDRRRRPAGGRRGGRAPPPRRLWRQSDLRHHARCRRPVRLAPARRSPCLDAGVGLQAAARRPRQPAGRVQGLRGHHQRAVGAAADPARPHAA